MNDRMMVAGPSRWVRFRCAMVVCVVVTTTAMATAMAQQRPAVIFTDAGAAAGIGFVHQRGHGS